MNSLICDFIRANPDWYDILSSSPYSLKIKKSGKYVLFMYNQIESDFYIPLVREARGIIIDIDRIVPVCWAFNKFGNYGEGYIDEIDWSTAHVQEKVDGSIIKIWFDGSWHMSSNGMIDAHDAILDQSNISLGQIVDDLGWINYSCWNPNYTHIFELVSPYNQVVIDYGKTELYYIGRRNMITGEEEFVDRTIVNRGDIRVPREYSLNTLEDCLVAAKSLESEGVSQIEHEGFVVVDANFHRIKIKNPAYVAAHHIRSKQPTFEDVFEVWLKNEQGEFLSVFPAYQDMFDFIGWHVNNIKTHLSRWEEDYNRVGRDKFYLYCGRAWFQSVGYKCADYEDFNFEHYLENDREHFVRILKNRWKREKNG